MTPLDIPGVKEAIAREQFLRDAAFILDVRSVAGFRLRTMSLGDFLNLRAIRHPLIMGGIVGPRDLAIFLWLMLEDYAESGRGRKAFMRMCRQTFFSSSPWLFRGPFWQAGEIRRAGNYVRILTEVKQYVEDLFMDAPGNSKKQFFASYYSDGAFWCAMLGREYGWTPDIVLKCKLPVLFQFRNEMLQRQGLPVGNPSDRIANDFLAKENDSNRTNPAEARN